MKYIFIILMALVTAACNQGGTVSVNTVSGTYVSSKDNSSMTFRNDGTVENKGGMGAGVYKYRVDGSSIYVTAKLGNELKIDIASNGSLKFAVGSFQDTYTKR